MQGAGWDRWRWVLERVAFGVGQLEPGGRDGSLWACDDEPAKLVAAKDVLGGNHLADGPVLEHLDDLAVSLAEDLVE